MLNPLVLLSAEALDQLIAEGHFYFVRQSYPRGISDNSIKEALLITPYKSNDEAYQHYGVIRFDHRKEVYNIDTSLQDKISPEAARIRLYKAAAQPPGYRVYLNRLKDREWKPTAQLAKSMEAYIKVHTNWKARGSDIKAALSLQFGQLIIKLRNGDDTMEVPLSEFEKL